MVKKVVLDRFVRLGGYDIVKFRNGKPRNISLASQRTGLSRPTIYAILKKYPEKPSKTTPKYYKEFKESGGYKTLKKEYGKKTWFKQHITVIREGFAHLENKDPMTWTEEDFQKLWDKWHDSRVGTIAAQKGLEFRRLMRLLPEGTKYLRKFKTKQAKPKKTHWYLEESEILAFIKATERVDVLILFLFGIFTGSRISGILTLKPENINWTRNTLFIYETKIKTEVTKYLGKSYMTLLNRYVKDFHIKGKQRCFPLGDWSYNKILVRTGYLAGIQKTTSSHILKHTFVQQMIDHGAPSGVVVQQSHTELRTLEKWYSFRKEDMIRKHIQGEEWNPEPFNVFADRIVAEATRRYEQIS